MLRRFAFPFFDVPAIAGDASAVADAPPAVESDSLSDHEAEFSPDASVRAPAADNPADEGDVSTDRDASGRFTKRHRAASQRASADDVAAIDAQTKRLRELETKHGIDTIERQPGESDRVYNLRRRADLLERLSSTPEKPPASPATASAPTAPPAAARRADVPQTFPTYEAFIAIQGNEEATYEDYVDARADWRFAIQRANESQAEVAARQQQTIQQQFTRYNDGLAAAKTKYPDWDAVVTADARLTPTMMAAILSAKDPHAVAYYLGTHPEVRVALNAGHPGYNDAAVADLRADLDSLVASQRSTPPPSRTAVAPTGSTPAAPLQTPPRPPNPVRTGTIATADTPPGDEDSLAAHEKHFGRKRR